MDRASRTQRRDLLLDLRVEEGARLIALEHLESATQARGRLASPEDSEALHDLRVALRRLRSLIRAYRPHLEDSVSGKLRRRLRDLAGSTNSARDSEVQIEWLTKQRSELGARHRGGLTFLIDWLERRKQLAYAHVRADVSSDFDRLADLLKTRLLVYRSEISLDARHHEDTFAQVTGRLIREHAAELGDELKRVRSVADQEEAHQARIAAKRLRYLLDPLRAQVPAAAPPISRLKAMQELLGELHDVAVLTVEIGAALEEASVEQARRLHERAMQSDAPRAAPPRQRRDPRPGLLALARLIRERRDRLFGELDQDWLRGGGAALVRDVDELGLALSGEEAMVERHFVLRALPELATGSPAIEIEEGFIAGHPIEERLRRVRDEAGEHWLRQIRCGEQRTETAIVESLFRALWPFASERRASARIHRFTDGTLSMEIVEYLGRQEPLAIVRWPSHDPAPPIADWLARLVVREVTGDLEVQAACALGR